MFINSEYGNFQIDNYKELLSKLNLKELPEDFELVITEHLKKYNDSSWKAKNHKIKIKGLEVDFFLDEYYEDDPEYDEGYYYLLVEYLL